MKVIFLDIDGVLNCEECFKRHHDEWEAAGKPQVYKWWNMLEPEHIEQLNRIVASTGASICVSSTWRGDPKIFETLKEAGVVANFVGTTPHMHRPTGTSVEYMERGKEIQAWLEEHPDVGMYCIVDDDSDMLPHQKHFKTDFRKALTKEIADDIIKYLGPLQI